MACFFYFFFVHVTYLCPLYLSGRHPGNDIKRYAAHVNDLMFLWSISTRSGSPVLPFRTGKWDGSDLFSPSYHDALSLVKILRPCLCASGAKECLPSSMAAMMRGVRGPCVDSVCSPLTVSLPRPPQEGAQSPTTRSQRLHYACDSVSYQQDAW